MLKHIIKNNGEEYWLNEREQFHREDDGPAIIWGDGSEGWYYNNSLSRENGSPVVYADGYEWCKSDKK